jgi:hypothetical protein
MDVQLNLLLKTIVITEYRDISLNEMMKYLVLLCEIHLYIIIYAIETSTTV